MMGCFIFFFALAIFFFCIGWGFLAVTIISILVITLAKLYVEKRKGKAHLDDVLTKYNEEKLKSQDHSDKVLVMPEKKQESLSADIKRLKYMDEDQLNVLLPRFAAMYGISLALLWEEIRKAKAEMPDKNVEKDLYWRDFYADCYNQEVDDLELEDLDEEEREELIEDLYDEQEEILDDYEDQMDDLDDDFDNDFDSGRNDVYGNPDFWDSQES